MSKVNHESVDENDEEGSEWTLETTSVGTNEDGNAQGIEGNSTNALKEALTQLEKLKEVEEKETPIIQAIQERIDESAKGMATQNAEHHKRKYELEELKEKCQKKIAKLESKNLKENANFAKGMATLKEGMKEKINWNRVDLVMDKKLVNQMGNRWNLARCKNSSITISADGRNITYKSLGGRQSVFAEKGFDISAGFSGPVLYYFEVISIPPSQWQIYVGLSCGNVQDLIVVGGRPCTVVGSWPNSFATCEGTDSYWLSGNVHHFEWPNGAIIPKSIDKGEVMGCGLLLNPEKGLFIFFTSNGILLGKQIPINPTVNALYPTVSVRGNVSVEANFGDDLAKPFKYDIKKCPGMVFE